MKGLPCGYIEFHEDYLTAARREVKEETGLEVEITALLSVASNFLRADIHTLAVAVLDLRGGQLSGAAVERIVRAVEPYEYERVYGAFWDTVIERDGKAAVARSAERYLRAIRGEAR